MHCFVGPQVVVGCNMLLMGAYSVVKFSLKTTSSFLPGLPGNDKIHFRHLKVCEMLCGSKKIDLQE